MHVLIDENVPQSVADFFAERGHTVSYVREVFLPGTPDPVVAAIGDRMSAVVVTWDQDFRTIASRVPRGNVNRVRNLGRISFKCDYAQGRRQLERWIEQIELHYKSCQGNPDKRMIVEIQGNGLKLW